MPVKPLFFCLLISTINFSQAGSQDELPKENLYELENKPEATFYLLTPPAYDETKEYPLIISLHGAGEKGDRMVRYWKDAAAKRGMILLCPNSKVFGWDHENVMNILHCIDHTIRNCSVNRDQVLLTGISAGGMITYALGLTGKGMFPFINPMSTTLREEYLVHSSEEQKPKIYITHGAMDQMILAELGGEKAAKILEDRGFDVTFVLRPEDGHEVPEGEQEKILEWFVPVQHGSE